MDLKPIILLDPDDQPEEFLTIEERKKIREAALEYGSVPAYNGLTPEGRDKWKAHLAQRFDKLKSDISKSDWNRANGWKLHHWYGRVWTPNSGLLKSNGQLQSGLVARSSGS